MQGFGNDISAFMNSCSEIEQESFIDESFFRPKKSPKIDSSLKKSPKKECEPCHV